MALTNEISTNETDAAVAGAAAIIADGKAQLSRKGKIAAKTAAEAAGGSRRVTASGRTGNLGKKPAQSSDTKAAMVLNKLRSSRGATIEMLRESTGWQAHSVRGFLSAVVKKKLGLNLVSETGRNGVRRYRIDDAASTSK